MNEDRAAHVKGVVRGLATAAIIEIFQSFVELHVAFAVDAVEVDRIKVDFRRITFGSRYSFSIGTKVSLDFHFAICATILVDDQDVGIWFPPATIASCATYFEITFVNENKEKMA